ncbi:hypothetical protein E2562_039373 [Oryza meyeriana var. granulata]|uniref:Plastocyanin-like domain-containing protein n=1 Tax=Oryza meyeriana var. granulata TaxID=110450 RepID=A0A6G1CLJ5_9ORYZ|nr:hypothetical protein E2562_039373 [Oryza meyeriana var. granulata]
MALFVAFVCIVSWASTRACSYGNGGVPTVVHLYGSVHPPQSDGSAFAWFTAGFGETGLAWSTPTYTYPNTQSPDVLWYHNHALGLTRANLLGAYVIRNSAVDAPLGLPCGDEFDRVLMLADRSFYADGSIYMNYTGDNPNIHPQWQPEYFGEAITVNGKAWPFLAIARRRYRFRIINTSNASFFNLSLTNDLPFTVVGSDTNYLSKPITATSLLVSVAETFDVVIDFSESTTSEAELVNMALYSYMDGNAPNDLNGKVMKFVISPAKAKDESSVPVKLLDYLDVAEEEAVQRRYIMMCRVWSCHVAGVLCHGV